MKYQKGTFVTVPNIQSLQQLPATAQALFMWLCSYADSTGECYPSRSLLAQNLFCSVRTVDTHLENLIEAGFLSKEHRFRGNEKTSNLYQIMLVEVEQDLQGGSAKSAPPLVQNLHEGSAKSAHRTKPIEPNPKELNTPEVSGFLTKPLKAKYGEMKNVLLSEEEKQKLKDLYGVTVAKDYVEKLSLYLASTGRRYKDHYATIRAWLRRDKVVMENKPEKAVLPQSEPVISEAEQKKILARRAEITKKLKGNFATK